jgi:hypothetical protein
MEFIFHINYNVQDVALKYEAYPQNKFRLQILSLQCCGHDGAHLCRVCWSFGKAWTPFADNRTTFTHHPVCLQCSRKSRSPPHVKCGLKSVSWMQETWNRPIFIVNFVRRIENMPWVSQWYGDGWDTLLKDMKMCMISVERPTAHRLWRFGACSGRKDSREQTIHHFVTFHAFSTNFTVTSSRNCV